MNDLNGGPFSKPPAGVFSKAINFSFDGPTLVDGLLKSASSG